MEGCAASPEAGSLACRSLLPMPCQRLAVKDAEGVAQRSKILDGEGHGHTLSRAARLPHHPSALTPAGQTSLPATHRAIARCRLPSRPDSTARPDSCGLGNPACLWEQRMAATTLPTDLSRTQRARGLGAPRGGRARSAAGRRSSSRSPAIPVAPANALSRYRRKVSNHPLVACDDPAGWRRGARMNLRALAAADPDTPERQRNCGVIPVGDRVEIRMKDGSAYYCGLETCGNVWLCPVCSAKIHHRTPRRPRHVGRRRACCRPCDDHRPARPQ